MGKAASDSYRAQTYSGKDHPMSTTVDAQAFYQNSRLAMEQRLGDCQLFPVTIRLGKRS